MAKNAKRRDVIALSDITPNPDNPRHIRDGKFAELVDSISKFSKMMRLRPMVLDENCVVLGGNMRLKALEQMGKTEIPREWVIIADDLTEAEKREFVIKDNVAFGEWDWEIIANEWPEAGEWGLDVPDETTEAEQTYKVTITLKQDQRQEVMTIIEEAMTDSDIEYFIK